MKTPYDGYDVLQKWDSPSFNPITRGVLTRRMHAVPERRFFTPEEYRVLEAVCHRLVPQPDRTQPVAIAPFIDADLHDGKGGGFRDPKMPPAAEAWRNGLAGVDRHAQDLFKRPFADLDFASQDAVLTSIQEEYATPESFGDMPPKHFFEQLLLKEAVGVYYSHPAAWNEMGFGGPASPRGYVRLGLDDRDPWEAPLAAPAGDTP